jgi:hypothetical protein
VTASPETKEFLHGIAGDLRVSKLNEAQAYFFQQIKKRGRLCAAGQIEPQG